MALTRWLMVLVLLQVLPAMAQGGEFPWKPGDAPPPVAGIRLGDGLVRIEAALGQPSETQKLGEDIRAFTYKKHGLEVLYASHDGVAIIFLLSRTAGDIGGVRFGDTREQVLARWGAPASVKEETAYYRAGDWVVILRLDENDKVVQLGVGRAVENPPPGAKFYRKTD